MAFDGKNIKFLQGSYDKLKTLTTSEVGAFYITNDTHEMFLGVDAEKAPVALNRWVDVKDRFADITKNSDYEKHPGKIYYAKAENILCTWDGANWVQINPNTDTSLKDFIISSGQPKTDAQGKKSVTYTLSFSQKDIKGEVIKDAEGKPVLVSADLVITDELVTSLVVDVQVGLAASVDKGVATINTVGAGSDSGEGKTVKVSGEKGIAVKGGGANEIVISGTEHTLTAVDTAVTLKADGANVGAVNFIGDDANIEIVNANIEGVDQLKVVHKTPSAGSDVTPTNSGTSEKIDVAGRTFTALTGLKADANGHITDAEATTFEIPNTVYTLGKEEEKVEAKDEEGNVVATANYTTAISLVDGENKAVSAQSIATAHTITIDGTEKIIKNGESIGDFYSAKEIDRQFRVLDALTYKGTVSKAEDIPTEASLGDTYKVNAKFGDYEVGDLIIANGTTEGADGKISGTITWDHISTGSDADTQYELVGNDNTIGLKESVEGKISSYIEVVDDAYITAEVKDDVFTIKHNEIAADKTDTDGQDTAIAYGGTFTAVTNVVRDKAGHVESIETTDFTIPGDDYVAVDANANSFAIKTADHAVKGSVSINAAEDNVLTVTSIADDKNENIAVTVAHNEIGHVVTPVAASNVTLALNGENNTVTVVDGVATDNFGHITEIKTKVVSIASETTYELSGPTGTEDKDEIVYTLNSSVGGEAAGIKGGIKLTTETLTYDVQSEGAVKIDLLWGSF